MDRNGVTWTLGLDTLNVFLSLSLGKKISSEREEEERVVQREREREKEKGLIKEEREHVLVFVRFFFFSERFPSRSRALESSKTTRP